MRRDRRESKGPRSPAHLPSSSTLHPILNHRFPLSPSWCTLVFYWVQSFSFPSPSIILIPFRHINSPWLSPFKFGTCQPRVSKPLVASPAPIASKTFPASDRDSFRILFVAPLAIQSIRMTSRAYVDQPVPNHSFRTIVSR